MSGKNVNFTQIPNKIFTLKLDAHEIAVFCALKMHGKTIFPGHRRLGELLGGVSRDKIGKSLNTLKKCNIIQWDTGKGKSNHYFILGEGCWVPATRTTRCLPHVQPGACHTYTNNINLKRLTNNKAGGDFITLVDKIKNIGEVKR